ncbi:MAG: D-glycerate dehydrogenase, partial [Myxococcota bacterium]|nr:D-glycerate dehydrogenase [Myxococcota bacterium]
KGVSKMEMASHPGSVPRPSQLKADLEQALAAKGPDYVARTRHKDASGKPRFTNRLILSTSPYLLQHAHNPVDWRPWGPEALAEGAARADGLLCLLTDPVDERLFERCPGLRVVSSCSVGLDHVDLEAATRRGIPVGFTPGVLAQTTADLAFALLLASARRVVEADRAVRAGEWTWEHRWDPEAFLGRDVHGATLGILGLGAIGRAVANRAQGFGMHVLGWSRSGREVAGVERVTFEGLLRRADFVTVHLALSADTRGILDAEAMGRLKPGAVLVNSARGGILDEAALVAALESGRLAAAALDVFASEPLAPDSPLLTAPNLVLTPHIGSASVATRERMADLAGENLLAGLEGRAMPECANPGFADALRG